MKSRHTLFKALFIIGQSILIADFIWMAVYLSDITYYKQVYFDGRESMIQSRNSFGVYHGDYHSIKDLYPEQYTRYEVSVQQGIFATIMIVGLASQVPAWIGVGFGNVYCLRVSSFLTAMNAVLSLAIIFMFQSLARVISLICLVSSLITSLVGALLSDKLSSKREQQYFDDSWDENVYNDELYYQQQQARHQQVRHQQYQQQDYIRRQRQEIEDEEDFRSPSRVRFNVE